MPATTPPGTYDVGVTATVAGLSRAATGQITVTAPLPVKTAVVATTTTAAAKLTLAVAKTTLKAARKTGVALTITLSRRSAVSIVALQAKPKVSVTVKKTLTAGKKTVVLVKSAPVPQGQGHDHVHGRRRHAHLDRHALVAVGRAVAATLVALRPWPDVRA